MTGRLVLAIASTILEEVAIVAIVLWALPRINVHIPLWGMLLIMVTWASYSIFTFRMGTRALKREQLIGMHDMIGTKGVVITSLTPEGLVRIRGELWVAKSAGGEIKPGTEVTVTGQERLKIVVRESDSAHNRKDSD
jgi:membrane-bound ClpP family serine protease